MKNLETKIYLPSTEEELKEKIRELSQTYKKTQTIIEQVPTTEYTPQDQQATQIGLYPIKIKTITPQHPL
jgi:hypothetical protein